ncbi:MAG TPA: DnaA/Hda family protein [Caulobacteraceae bacterium]
MARQLRLKLKRPASHARADFVLSPTNESAVRAVDAWPDWPGQALALVGPEGSGKTHLARAWAETVGAVVFEARAELAALEGRPVLVEDIDRGADDEALFHLFNMAGLKGGGLLLTARKPPMEWKTALPDLRSRLNALTVAELGAPDDVLLRRMLEKFFRERSIRPGEDVYEYLLRRIERSVPAAREVVRRLDEAADEQHRAITRMLAREVLDADGTLELFE